jgi:hypothetical protein
MLTPEQAKAIVIKKLPKGIKLNPEVTDYRGYYVFGIADPDYVGMSPMGVNKLTGLVKEFNYFDPGLIKACKKQHPEFFEN